MRLALSLFLFGCMHLVAVAARGDEVAADPNRIKAAFLRNFAHYVTWPATANPDGRSAWRICILGRDPFGRLLDETLSGRTEQGRPFEILRTANPDDLPACQILYVAYDDPARRRATLNALNNLPVLTVGDAGEFLAEGGMIRFQVGDRVEMSINLDRARAASLGIQTKMLEVSRQVLENGVLRNLR